jgi:hypothetical protein
MRNSLTLALSNDTVPSFTSFVEKYFKHTVIIAKVCDNDKDMSGETKSITVKANKHISDDPFIFYTLGMCWQEEHRKQIIASFS